MIEIREEKPFGQEIAELLAESDAYSVARYPEDGRHPVDIEFLASPCVRFFVARLGTRAVGCAALVIAEDRTAELKRMIVLPAARGRGVGRILLQEIDAAAANESVRVVRLETGPRNHEALGLYRRHGYRERGPFGGYEAGPHSVFMEKLLPEAG